MPEISVIIPVYNVEEYLCHCVDSVLAQTFKDIEVILVDDGSTDRCPQICDHYQKKDPRVKVIHKKNGGQADARNAGLEIASGIFIGFVDADDFVSPRMFDVLYRYAKSNDADIVKCKMKFVKEGDTVIEPPPAAPIVKIFKGEDIVNNYYPDFLYLLTTTVCNKLYSKKIFCEIRFPKGQYYEDSYINLSTIDCCKTIITVDEELYYYLQREGSTMHSEYSPKWFQGTNNNNNNNMLFFKKKHLREQVNYAQAEYLTRFCKDKFAVEFYRTVYKKDFKEINRQFIREIPTALINPKICKLKKLVMLLIFISPKTALRLCRKYFPECLYDFMR